MFFSLSQAIQKNKRFVLSVFSVVLLLEFSAAVFADTASKRTSQVLSNNVYKQLSEAQIAIEEKNYDKALLILATLNETKKKPLNDFERANSLNLYAFIYYSQGQYSKALKSYQGILALEKAPQSMLLQAQYSQAQLYFASEQWQQGVSVLLNWFERVDKPSASAYVLLSQGYYQLKRWDLALNAVSKAIGNYKSQNKLPKESWFTLQYYLYYKKNDYLNAVAVTDELLKYYPKKHYWLQLSSLYGELKLQDKQLAAMDAAYVQGFLNTGKELKHLAMLYLANDVPYKAAKVLQAGIDDGVIESSSKSLALLASAWREAQEIQNSIPVMAKAASKSDEGELWINLGNIYYDNDEYQKAVDAITAGLKKAGVDNKGRAQLVLGMSYLNLKQYSLARKAFVAAGQFDKTGAQSAQWLEYLNKELDRLKALHEV
jgi:hypothetical protein